MKCMQGAQSNIIANMNAEGADKTPLIGLLSNIGMFLVLFLTFPLFVQALRGAMHEMIFSEEAGFLTNLIETASILALAWLVAVLLPSILMVMAYAGAGPGAVLVGRCFRG